MDGPQRPRRVPPSPACSTDARQRRCLPGPCPAIPGQEPLRTRVEPPADTRSTGTDGQPRPSGVSMDSRKDQGLLSQGQHRGHGPLFKLRYRAGARRRPAASPQAGLPGPCCPGPSPRASRQRVNRAHPRVPPALTQALAGGPGAVRAQVRELHSSTAATGTGGPAVPASGGAPEGGTRHSPAPSGLSPPRRFGRSPAALSTSFLREHRWEPWEDQLQRPARALREGSGQGGVHEGQRQNHPALPGQQEASLPP